MENVLTIQSEINFEETILKHDLVLVDFYANWCSPCIAIQPILETIAVEYAGKAVVAKVDVDRLQRLAEKFAVTSIPALYYFKAGKLIIKKTGLKNAAEIKSGINELLGK